MIARSQRWFATTVEPRLPQVVDLHCGALRLVAITPAMLAAEQRPSLGSFGRLLRAHITPEWPPLEWEPAVGLTILSQYELWPESFGWHRYVVLQEPTFAGLAGFTLTRRTLIGAVGGFPRAHGDVELGYSTLPAYQRRGFATAFVGTMVEWLLQQDDVRSVSAQTWERQTESIKVMERCGMEYFGMGDEPGTVRYRRRTLTHVG